MNATTTDYNDGKYKCPLQLLRENQLYWLNDDHYCTNLVSFVS